MKHTILFLLMILTLPCVGQEFNINVKVNAPRLNKVDPKVFQTMETQIREFLNNTRWTDDEFEPQEKIEGNLNIQITEEISQTAFAADFFFQIIRPVFNSNYKTPTLNIVDNVVFTYREFQPIENSFQNYYDPLSSLLTFHVYMMLGYDYDTFSMLGGDPYFQIAQNIVNSIPTNDQSLAREWQALGNRRNKYWMIENVNNPRVRPLRQAMYEYHIKSLDKMHENAGLSRAVMVSALTSINQVNRAYPNSVVVQTFADTKRNEIIEIFKGAGRGEQTKVYDIMVSIDPAQASQYISIK